MYINSGFLGQISKKYESLIAKINVFDSVHVWLHLTVSKFDFNVLVISITTNTLLQCSSFKALTVCTVAKVTVPPSSLSSQGSRTDWAPRFTDSWK
jgi:hypothetical protein